jgi:hypothetical protein
MLTAIRGEKNMPLPNFFILSAGKSGTTALYYTLKEHPEIFVCPVKEPHFFAWEGEPPTFPGPGGLIPRNFWVWRPRDYLRLFEQVTIQRAIGEASTGYLYSPTAAQRIWKNLPNSRLVVLLRQPAERAYSSYQFNAQRDLEPARTFAGALALEETRQRAGWYPALFYRAHGFYYARLAAYYNLFPRQQIKVYLYEDWKNTPQVMLRDLFRFLEVDENFSPELRRSNVTRLPKNRRLHNLATHPAQIEGRILFLPAVARRAVLSALQWTDNHFNLAPPPPLDPKLRARLTADYREDILKLQELIQRDLSGWLKT